VAGHPAPGAVGLPRQATHTRTPRLQRRGVELAEPAIAAAGQAAVLYDGDRVLAGGWIAR